MEDGQTQDALLTLPLGLTLFNSLGAVISDLGLEPVSLDLAQIRAQAEADTGLTDLGDGGLMDNLGVLVDAFQDVLQEMSLTSRLALRQECLRVIRGRLLIEAALKAQTPPDPEAPEGPIIVLGLPRTGTTVLHNLLCQDPAARVPSFWRLFSPVAGPGEGDGHRHDAVEGLLKLMERFTPLALQSHPMDADLPEECLWLFSFEGLSIQYDATYGLAPYRSHLLNVDWRPGVALHRRLLSLLQREVPGRRWVIKAPSHLLRLEALAKAYPMARFVWTHRDPASVLPSIGHLWEVPRYLTQREIDPAEIGRESLSFWSKAMTRALKDRAEIGEDRFIDVGFSTFVQDPKAEAQRVLGAMDLPVTPALDAAMAAFLEANPRTKRDVPVPIDLERYGLSREAVEAAMGPYIKRFGGMF